MPESPSRVPSPAVTDEMVEAAAYALATRLVNPEFGPTHFQLQMRERDRARVALEAALQHDPAQERIEELTGEAASWRRVAERLQSELNEARAALASRSPLPTEGER